MTVGIAISALRAIRDLGIDVTGADWSFTSSDDMPHMKWEIELRLHLRTLKRREEFDLIIVRFDGVEFYDDQHARPVQLADVPPIDRLRLDPEQQTWLTRAFVGVMESIEEEARAYVARAWDAALASVFDQLEVPVSRPESWPPPPPKLIRTQYHGSKGLAGACRK